MQMAEPRYTVGEALASAAVEQELFFYRGSCEG